MTYHSGGVGERAHGDLRGSWAEGGEGSDGAGLILNDGSSLVLAVGSIVLVVGSSSTSHEGSSDHGGTHLACLLGGLSIKILELLRLRVGVG